MSLKKIMVAFAALLALGAIAANSASAANVVVEPPSVWHTGAGGTALPVGSSKPITCKATTSSTELTLSAPVLGVPFKLKATGVTCLPHQSPETNAKIEEIENPVGTKRAIALGKIKFTGVSVVEPSGCKVPPELTTEALKVTLWEEREGSATGKTLAVIEKFAPTGTAFIKIPITECAIESEPSVTGTQCALAETEAGGNSATGELKSPQRLKFDAAVQATGECSLKLGPNAATLMGTVDNELVGGEVFGASET